MANNYISIGNRVEVIRKSQGVIESSDELTSKVVDASDDRKFKLTMPKSKTDTILLDIGEEPLMYFNTSHGILSGRAVVVDRFFEDNSAFIMVELITELKKVQRRQYYRLQCSIAARIHVLTRTEKFEIGSFTGDAKTIKEEKNRYINNVANITADWFNCMLVDLSGGGIKCVADKKIEVGELVILDIELGEESIISRYFLLMKIKACNKQTNAGGEYEIRTEFAEMKDSDRDAIVKFIFEEERKIRNKINL